jgi:hypothetical protein
MTPRALARKSRACMLTPQCPFSCASRSHPFLVVVEGREGRIWPAGMRNSAAKRLAWSSALAGSPVWPEGVPEQGDERATANWPDRRQRAPMGANRSRESGWRRVDEGKRPFSAGWANKPLSNTLTL